MAFEISLCPEENRKNFEDWKRKFTADSKLLKEENGDIDILSLNNKTLKNGVSNIFVENVKFPIFFNNKKGKLYVFLSGGRTPGKDGFLDALPRFKRWSFCEYISGSVVVIDDPMYSDFSDLRIGWFFGSKNKSYIDLVTKIIRRIAEINGVNDDEIIFFSSSSGGFASIHAASKFDKSNCIVINSQIELKNDYYLSKFEKLTGNNLKYDDPFLRNNTYRVIEKSNANYFIIQNIFDDINLREHFIPFCKHFNINAKFGFSESDNIKIYSYAASGGHVAYENNKILKLILQLGFGINSEEFADNLTLIWEDYRG